MGYTKLTPRSTRGASVEEYRSGDHDRAYHLTIPAGPADRYRLAQLDDYAKISRRNFPLRSRLSLSLSARASSSSIPGTWGFGLWNDPFGLSLGFGGNPFRLPTLPNAVWFFGASKESHLSFRDDKPAQGFLAQSFRSRIYHPRLILAALTLPFSRKLARQLLGRVIGEDGIDLGGRSLPGLDNALDVTQWHKYELHWHEDRVSFEVDEAIVFESPVSPLPPLGLVIWIDNQYAAFTPEGRIGFGVLENPEPAWLEVKEIDINSN